MSITQYIKRPETVDYTRAQSAWNNTTQALADTSQRSIQQIKDAGQSQQQQTQADDTSPLQFNNGDDVLTALLNQNYKESAADIKRQRTADFIGNLAKVAGQTLASSKGARQFTPLEDKTSYYNEQLRKLRENRNALAIKQSLTEKKYEMQAKQERMKQQFQMQRDAFNAQIKAQLEAGLIDKRTAATMQQNVAKAKDAQDLAKIKHGYNMDEIDKRNKGGMAVAQVHETNANKRSENSSGGSKVQESMIGTNNSVWTRNSRLTSAEARSIFNSYNTGPNIETLDPLNPDYVQAAMKIVSKGNVPDDVLSSMGFNKNGNQSFDKSKLKRGSNKESKEEKKTVPPLN